MHTASQPISFLRLDRVLRRFDMGRSTAYKQVTEGILPPPISISARRVAWVESEIDAVLAARVAGADDDAIRALVTRLVDERQSLVPEPALAGR